MESSVKKIASPAGLLKKESEPVSISPRFLVFDGVRKLWYRIGHWETWDWRIKYIFIAPAWIWFCLRARSLWFFTASNPTLTFGGFEGESKKEMYAQLPPGSYPKSIFTSYKVPLSEILECIRTNQLDFPVAVKPDAGKMGLMFRKINSSGDLNLYHHKIQCDYIIQEWVHHPTELSVFYYRMPHAQKGNITGFIRKDFLEVIGDGTSTLEELILKYPRVRFRIQEMKAKHKDHLNKVLSLGVKYCLSPALNLSRGGKLVSLEHQKDEKILKVFDEISHYTGNFYFGRFDIKCDSLEELREGKNFSILEYNGSGAEPHHVYGNGYSLWQACKILVFHWKMLFRISQLNRQAGIAYWKFGEGLNFLIKARKHLKKLKHLDSETIIN